MQLWLAVAILLLAFAARLYRLIDSSIWWDEGWAIWMSRLDVVRIALRTASDEHPPLYYWLLHYWDILAGETAFAVRYTSVFFGVASVALAYRLGVLWFGFRVGIIAALFLAASRFHIWWSQDVKMYSLAIFLGLVACYLFIKMVRGARWPYWVAWWLTIVASLHTTYIAALVPLIQNWVVVALLVFDRATMTKRLILRWIGVQVAVAIAFLPWFLIYYQNSLLYKREQPFDPLLFLQVYATAYSLGISTELHLYTILVCVISAVALLGIGGLLFRRSKGRRDAGWLVTAALLAFPVVLYLLSLPEQGIYQPKMAARYTVLFVPFIGYALARGITMLWRLTPTAGVVALLLVFGGGLISLGFYYAARYPEPTLLGLERAAGFIRAHAASQDAVVLYPDKDWPCFATALDARRYNLSLYYIPYGARMSPKEADHWLSTVAARHQTIWLVTPKEVAERDPKGDVRRWLATNFREADRFTYGQVRVGLYHNGVPDAPLTAVPERGRPVAEYHAEFEGMILQGFGKLEPRYRTGDSIRLVSYWQATALAEGDYVARIVIERAGERIAARRATPLRPGRLQSPLAPGELIRAEHTLAVAPSLASGVYKLTLEVEATGSGRTVTIPAGDVNIVQQTRGKTVEGLVQHFSYDLGDAVRLTGYSLFPRPVRQGERLRLTLLWECLGDTDVSYSVFVHLLDADGRGWAQFDGPPVGGSRPTNTWLQDEDIIDVYEFNITRDIPPGEYTIAVGMYDPTTGERLPVDSLAPEVAPDNRIFLFGAAVTE